MRQNEHEDACINSQTHVSYVFLPPLMISVSVVQLYFIPLFFPSFLLLLIPPPLSSVFSVLSPSSSPGVVC